MTVLSINEDQLRGLEELYAGRIETVLSSPQAVAEAVAGFFPGVAHTVLERSIERYAAQKTWALDPLIRENGFVAMRDVLVDGGVVRGRHAYERLVRPALALDAMGQGAAHD